MNVIHVNYNQNVLMVAGRGDWEATHEVGGCPLFAGRGFAKAMPGSGLGTEWRVEGWRGEARAGSG